MPEGDTVWRTATHLHEAIGGQVLTRSDFRVPKYATLDLAGQEVDEVVSVGKHILHRVGDLTIHSHLKMEGSWHIYQHGTAWRRPAFEARVVLETAERVTVGFSLGVLEVIPRDQEHTVVGHLGPDILGPDWGDEAAEEIVRRIAAQPDRAIGLALLDQRNAAGIGNVYRAELCFLRGVLPTRPVREVPDLPAMIALARRTMRANRDRIERTTTGDLRRGRTDWVYGRKGKACLRCGTRILQGQLGDPVRPGMGAQDRVTYWCPRCQT
ncbi:DNA-formamidopyrimidine glycosylase family protein [Clavibacter sepedonicus]|uniref:DNA-(apurinic or apyrimidinic site) lyase n=1 Tax=Clavibacter sepedonicus TaxID=31964 RepID=B0RBX4_CLASE|nr:MULTISPECIES: DNA-formamidopyrimidine glycosylase family protein [Clavibacter]MBD5383024.1 Fpg/Nei family DNA glycosylase [Clavibacter sp.]OQJ48937.1 DNA glycosylase [Clavibacter sepedonicus]OQJ53752.1 DNA glycosylase [Clavibacter sepedonicus]UUK65249.1 Fpg/Nei family DNA glycosylase [Clavibacter sepedonicus]CAQ00526.1 DNA glycosylase [Clavibacter sepedonicus]